MGSEGAAKASEEHGRTPARKSRQRQPEAGGRAGQRRRRAHLYTLVSRSCCRCTSSITLRNASSCRARGGAQLSLPAAGSYGFKPGGAWRPAVPLTLNAGRFSAGHCATSCSNSKAVLPNILAAAGAPC